MGFGGNGAVVSPWSIPFFCFFSLFDFVSCGGRKGGGGKLPTGSPTLSDGIPSSSPIPPILHLNLSRIGVGINVGILRGHSRLCATSNALRIVHLVVPGSSVAGCNA
jgi:hypothetical protein